MVWTGPVNPEWSYPLIVNLAGKSGISFTVTSTYRPGSTAHGHADYHSQGMAVDFSGSTASMAKLAAWFHKLSPYLLEEIHSGSGGFFVKNGKVVGADYYRSDISGHYDHVHIAMSKQGVAQAAKAIGAGGILVDSNISPIGVPAGGTGLGNLPQSDQITAVAQALESWSAFSKKVTDFVSLPNIGTRFVSGLFGLVFIFTGLFIFAMS